MISVKINNNTQFLPESWNELTLLEAQCFAENALAGVEKENLKLSLLLTRFPELKKTLRKLEKVQRKGDHEQFWERTEELTILLEQLYNFLYKEITVEKEKINVIDSKLTIQLIPSIAGFIGPENFSKLEIWEFSLAEMAFNDYFSNGMPESLNKLIAILYRPKKLFLSLKKKWASYNGDPRQPFNDQLIAGRADKIARESETDKYLVSLWFEGWLKQLPELFPKLYEKKVATGVESGLWSDTILLVARNEHHEADQVARRNLFQFLRERELQIIEREQTELEIERMRSKR
jgi:hypothetical protein